MNLVLKIYDDSGKNIVKSYESKTYDLMFGTVMKLMELLKVEDMDNQAEMLKTIYGAWGEIKTVLAGVFPEATDDDWKHVRVKELLPMILEIAKFSVTEMFTIPTEKN
jgi:hypothetical protein